MFDIRPLLVPVLLIPVTLQILLPLVVLFFHTARRLAKSVVRLQ